MIYFDFKQVYDTVCHSKLLAKLTSYGICGNTLAWIEAFLCSHSQSVYISQSISTPKSVVNGVPQGSVLGPMQFLLFINDLVDIFNDIPMSLSLFADDLKLYTYYKGDASHDDLQTATDRLIDWWQLDYGSYRLLYQNVFDFRIINPQWKLSHIINNKHYYIENNVLPFSDHIQDLGIYHDTRLKYDQHISLIVHKAYTRAIRILSVFILAIHLF